MLASDGLNWLSQCSSAASLQGHDPHFLSDLLVETVNGFSYTGRIFYFSVRHLQLTSSDDTIFYFIHKCQYFYAGKAQLMFEYCIIYPLFLELGIKILLTKACHHGRDLKKWCCDVLLFTSIDSFIQIFTSFQKSKLSLVQASIHINLWVFTPFPANNSLWNQCL